MIDKPFVLFPGGGEKDANAELVRKLEAGWEEQLKLLAFVARYKKASFDAHVAAGFTAAQALELVR